MADDESNKFLSRQLPRYFQIHLQRAWDDTWQALGARMKLAIVFAICGVIVAYAIASYAGKPEDMSLALYSGLLLIATTLATSALTLLVYFRYYFFTAPSRIYWEDQKKIADLQLDHQLNLDIGIPHVLVRHRSVDIQGLGRFARLGRDGLMIFLRDIRFTNRSKTNKVSLGLTLLVALGSDPDGGERDYVVVKEGKRYWDKLPTDLLFSPIDIDPERTEAGNICFLVRPETVRDCGGGEALDHSRCLLDVVDYISGKKLTKDIDQRLLEPGV